MKLHFKQSAHVGGKDYKCGMHDVPDDAGKDGFLDKLMKAGMVEHVEAQAASPSSHQDHQKQLAEKLAMAPKVATGFPVDPSNDSKEPESNPEPESDVTDSTELFDDGAADDEEPLFDDEQPKDEKPKAKKKKKSKASKAKE